MPRAAEDAHAALESEAPLFTETLALGRTGSRLHGAPIGVLTHAAAIGALVLGSLLSSDIQSVPTVAALVPLQLAPPPALAQRRGTPAAERRSVAATLSDTSLITPSPAVQLTDIPEEILAPSFDLSTGFDDGFDDGSLDGMAFGVPAGAIGGVPGGLVGGQIGGTGTVVPDYPPPDSAPRPIRMPKASYTEEAIRAAVTGAVKLLAVIDERGKVRVLEVIDSIEELDAAAIRTVEKSWLFEPALKNGRPIPCVSHLVVRFRLR